MKPSSSFSYLSAILLASSLPLSLATAIARDNGDVDSASIALPTPKQIAEAAKHAKPESPVSNVPGLAFHRFYQIWLENIDYSASANNPDMLHLARNGISLTNYWAQGHPSEDNYLAAIAGDSFGMDNDDFHAIPTTQNVSSIADLLDTRGVSWAEYQEHIPYPGFRGFNYSNQETWANDYVRKHNPLILLDSVATNDTRARQIKGFAELSRDSQNNALPQWAFITPNMTNDAHDTNITFAASWLRRYVEETLMPDHRLWNDTLFLLTFDENEHYPVPNRVFSILTGGAVPPHLRGTTDDTFYTHYSSIASVSANWGLPSLGRWDCGANIFGLVADKIGWENWDVDARGATGGEEVLLNVTLPGPLSKEDYNVYRREWPVPATEGLCSSGNGILGQVKADWQGRRATYNYSAPLPYDASVGYDVGVAFSKGGMTFVTGVNDTEIPKELLVPRGRKAGGQGGNGTATVSSIPSGTGGASTATAQQDSPPITTNDGTRLSAKALLHLPLVVILSLHVL